jgi:tellurite resistance protein TehA-like permease
MDVILFVIAIIILFISLWKMAVMKQTNKQTTKQEIQQNIILLAWGIPLISALVLIPYQVWVLSGKSIDWDGVYIIGGAAVLTIVISFTFYYKSKVKFS